MHTFFAPKPAAKAAQSTAEPKPKQLVSCPNSPASESTALGDDFAKQVIFWSDFPSSSSSDVDHELGTVIEESELCISNCPVEHE